MLHRAWESLGDGRIPVRLLLCISWLLMVPMTVSAQMDHTHSPTLSDDCTKLSLELQAVVAAMDGPGALIEASSKTEGSSAVESGLHKLEVALRPLSEVGLVGKESLSRQIPGQGNAMAGNMNPNENLEEMFGGFVRLIIPKDGIYRISLDSTLWIEVIDGEKPIERVKIAPRLHCGRIQKSLGFPLKRGRSYWLEMSRSKHRNVALIITEESKD